MRQVDGGDVEEERVVGEGVMDVDMDNSMVHTYIRSSRLQQGREGEREMGEG